MTTSGRPSARKQACFGRLYQGRSAPLYGHCLGIVRCPMPPVAGLRAEHGWGDGTKLAFLGLPLQCSGKNLIGPLPVRCLAMERAFKTDICGVRRRRMTSIGSIVSSDHKGPRAASPFAMPAAGWKQALQRAWRQVGEDNVGLAAAGVAFYGFLAIVPLLGAIVLSYGLIAEPATVIKNVRSLAAVMPSDAAKLVGEQLMHVVKTSGTRTGFGLLLALALALFGARNGASSVITGLNMDL